MNIVCQICGKEFQTNYFQAKTCSKACSNLLKKQNRANWVKENADYFREYKRKYYVEVDRDKALTKQKAKRKTPEGKAKRRQHQKDREDRDPAYKMKRRLRHRLYSMLKGAKSFSMTKYLGCTNDELKVHIESQFYHHPITGEVMSWANYGKGGWEIDHIKPLCLMDITSEADLKLYNGYKNLRPLWAEENVEKSKQDLLQLVVKKKEQNEAITH